MEKTDFKLSSRYYKAEVSIWILGAILILYAWLGLEVDQPLPFINVKLQNQNYFPHVVSATLFVVLMYFSLEWRQSRERARVDLINITRVIITTLWAAMALWFITPVLVENTVYEGVSRVWYLGFLGLGFVIGFFAQILLFSTVMIRDKSQAKNLNFPRIPIAVRAQYLAWGPVLLLLLVGYYTLHYFAPSSIVYIGTLLTAIAFTYMLVQQVAFLCMHIDSSGNRVPYKERISHFQEIYSFHDRSYELIDRGEKAASDIGVNWADPPKIAQDQIRKYYASKKGDRSKRFRVELLEEIGIEFYTKDGDSENQALDNFGCRIRNKRGDGKTVRALFKPEKTEDREVELVIPIKDVEHYVEEAVCATPKNEQLNPASAFSKGMNQAALDILLEDRSGHFLIRATEAGDMDAVKDLLGQGYDVNACREGGWTALLYSSAQNYPKIMKILLDAGANPDIGNALGITPLHFGARYGNIEIAEMLIDYGADINLQNKYGDTALMVAVQSGSIELVGILINARVNISIENLEKKTALDIAYEQGQGKIAKKIRNANIKPSKK